LGVGLGVDLGVGLGVDLGTLIVIFGAAITAFIKDFLGARNIDTNKLRPSLCELCSALELCELCSAMAL
jgi:hypothetical protein